MTEKERSYSIAGVRLSHPDRVLYREQGITKRELARYFEKVAGLLLPYAANRLVSLVRCPRGRDSECFFQRHASSGFPGEIHRLDVREKSGGKDEYLFLTDVAGLVAAAQMGVLEIHIWGARIDNVERPDRLVFDLDPDPPVHFERVKAAAVEIYNALNALDVKSFPMVTGGKGIHVVAPLMRRHDWPTVKAFAKALAARFEEEAPDRYTAVADKERRTGRIFIDYLRNARSASAIAPYSSRARKGAPLAMPVQWDELSAIRCADQFRLAEFRPPFADAWPDYGDIRQSLKRSSLRELGVTE